MNLKVKFTEQDQSFKPKFGEVFNVSDGGYERGLAEGEAIGFEKGHTEGMADGIEQGKQAERNAFWNALQDGGNKTDYSSAFCGTYWTDENFTPLYPISVTSGERMFYKTGITDFTKEGVVLDFSACPSVRWLFGQTQNTEIKLPTIDFSSASTASEAFVNYWGKDLTLIVSEQFGGGSSFGGCIYLENLTISGTIGRAIGFKDSSLLSAESVQGVIDCLKDLTGATTQKLTFHATVGAKLTDEQKATITAKNWTLVY